MMFIPIYPFYSIAHVATKFYRIPLIPCVFLIGQLRGVILCRSLPTAGSRSSTKSHTFAFCRLGATAVQVAKVFLRLAELVELWDRRRFKEQTTVERTAGHRRLLLVDHKTAKVLPIGTGIKYQ